MKWSWKLGRIAGIDVHVHATFVLLLGWLALSGYLRSHDARATMTGVLFMLAVFATVLCHELGHALVARRFGIVTRDITLLPIGGVARLERMPEKPSQELLVAIAGPAVNVLFAVVLGVVLGATHQPVTLTSDATIGSVGELGARLLVVNVTLAIFNLLPAFPMDGGRVLRALLALGGDYVQATRTAAKLGQGIALVLGLVGLAANPMLVFVAMFVWIGASSEATGVETKAFLHGVPAAAAMQTDFRVLAADDSLATAAQQSIASPQTDFPVVGPTGSLVGMLTRDDLIAGLMHHGAQAPVASAMRTDMVTTAPSAMLDVALERLREDGSSALPVLDEGRLVGLVTRDNVGELLLLHDALGRRAATRAA